jgi:hypothetical protein
VGEGVRGELRRSERRSEDISEPVCTYLARIFVKYKLMYLNVCAKKYVQILTTYVHSWGRLASRTWQENLKE